MIIRAQSREEIFADKILALALRPNRLKNRDLWDMTWLRQQGVELPVDLVAVKIRDRGFATKDYAALLRGRLLQLTAHPAMHNYFVQEMRRSLPQDLQGLVEQESFWRYLVDEVSRLGRQVLDSLEAKRPKHFC